MRVRPCSRIASRLRISLEMRRGTANAAPAVDNRIATRPETAQLDRQKRGLMQKLLIAPAIGWRPRSNFHSVTYRMKSPQSS